MPDKNENTEALGCLFGLLWLPVIIVFANLYRGFVLTKLWAWFIVTTFGLPRLSIPAAMGLALIINYLAKTRVPDPPAKSIWKTIGKDTADAVLLPSIVWLTGYIIQHWM